MYATDGSNYRQIPIGLVVPRDADDVAAAMAACRKYGAPVLPRGAGTSLAGQCCNVAVVLDFTKYMNRILELDPQRCDLRGCSPAWFWTRCATRRKTHKLTFAPDPSTHNRCTIGGMIGNNSCGTHSLLGGKTVDNVEELRILLYDGTQMTVGPTSDGRARFHHCARRAARRDLRQRCGPFATDTPDLIRARYPANSPARFRLQPR